MKRVLVTALDWGLGHATRCIPVIRELQRQGCEVLMAGSGDSLALLRKEFSYLPSFSLPAYNPRYALDGSMAWNMAMQLPRFARVISAEHIAVEKIAKRERVDALISDNRYGCWSNDIPSVFITHQSNLMMPQRFGLLQGLVRKMIERLINRFDFCWIPDVAAADSLAGELISFGKISVKAEIEYIGWLSRFQSEVKNPTDKYDVLAVLSGPEPQRTVLEDKLLPQLRASGLKHILVRGLPLAAPSEDGENVVGFLASAELESCLRSSSLVIARSGYSTVMDMSALGGKVVFVPTPGQTEQEYLAKRLMEKGIAFTMPQREFDLVRAIAESKNYSGFNPCQQNDLLPLAIRKLISRLHSNVK